MTALILHWALQFNTSSPISKTPTSPGLQTMLSEYAKIHIALGILKGVAEREGKRHLMDQQTTFSMLNLLEGEIIPSLQNELDYDPTPQYLWDDHGGEPPVTLAEMHSQAHQQHIEAHS